MKNQSIRRSRGFTLVELLIVIAIIMVLAALGFAGVQVAMKKAKTVQSLNLATNMAQAITNYVDEYGSLPVTAATAAAINTGSGEGVTLLKVLLAQEGSGTGILNTRSIRFLEAKTAKARKGGIDYGTGSSTTALGMYDAWGEPYYVAFDDDYNDEIANPDKVGSADPAILRGFKAVVYSAGADRQLGTKDDVRTW